MFYTVALLGGGKIPIHFHFLNNNLEAWGLIIIFLYPDLREIRSENMLIILFNVLGEYVNYSFQQEEKGLFSYSEWTEFPNLEDWSRMEEVTSEWLLFLDSVWFPKVKDTEHILSLQTQPSAWWATRKCLLFVTMFLTVFLIALRFQMYFCSNSLFLKWFFFWRLGFSDFKIKFSCQLISLRNSSIDLQNK